ncbi:MAG: hypothetical protein ACI9Z9_001555, partial [Litorivivens sp.]
MPEQIRVQVSGQGLRDVTGIVKNYVESQTV